MRTQKMSELHPGMRRCPAPIGCGEWKTLIPKHWYFQSYTRKKPRGSWDTNLVEQRPRAYCKICTRRHTQEDARAERLGREHVGTDGQRCQVCNCALTYRDRDRMDFCRDCEAMLDEVSWSVDGSRERWVEAAREVGLRRRPQSYKLSVALEKRYRMIATYLRTTYLPTKSGKSPSRPL